MKSFIEYINEAVVNKPYKQVTYMVPTWAINQLENGDDDGLSDEEETAIDKFVKKENLGFASLSFSDDVKEMCPSNDITGREADDCVYMTATWFWSFSIECGDGYNNKTVGNSFSKEDVISFLKSVYNGTTAKSTNVEAAVKKFKALEAKMDKDDDLNIRIFDSHENVSNGLVYTTIYVEGRDGDVIAKAFNKQLTSYKRKIK